MKSLDSTPSGAQPTVTSAPSTNKQINACDEFALAEYNNLRMEILKWLELQSRLLGMIVFSFGAIVSVGFQTGNPAIIAVHPVLALILGICWLNHNYAIVRAADYIRSRLEVRFYEGWEHYVLHYKISHGRIGHLGERAIFPGSSIIAVLAAVRVGHNNFWNIATIAAAAVVTVVTILLFLAYREGSFTPSARLREARDETGHTPVPRIIDDKPVHGARCNRPKPIKHKSE